LAAGIYKIIIEKGATKTIQLTYKDALGVPINLTGYQARGSIKQFATDTDVIADFTITIPTPTNGIILVVLPADALANYSLPGKAYDKFLIGTYDIELFKEDGTVIRLLNGYVCFSPEVSDGE
jgi:hypothetical protein